MIVKLSDVNSISSLEAFKSLPANQYVSYSSPLDWAIAAESETRLAVDILRVANV